MRMGMKFDLDQNCLEFSGFTKGHRSRMRGDSDGSVLGGSLL